MSPFKPKFFTTIKNYSKDQFLGDLTAGIIVAIIALPLSIALAIASGVSPEKGLHTAIIAGFLISFLGGSRVQIGGPTGAFMVIVYGIVTEFGVDGLIMATMMGGVMMIAMGLLKLGGVIKFIPHPITTGFTSGIAVTIFSSQIKDFFGLTTEALPAEFLEKWHIYIGAFHTLDVTTVIIGLVALGIIVFWPKRFSKIPGSLIALVVTTLIVQLGNLDVMTIGGKFGELSSAFPTPQLPAFSLEKMTMLIGPAFTIALLGSIESLLSAVVADGMIGGRHRSNTELIGQGIANVASGLFGGIPATGAIARTVANIKNGGTTPVAGMTHAVVLLLIMLLFMPLAQMVPLASLAAILMVVAYNMSEWREFISLLKSPKSDVTVLLITFFITVLVDLVMAIEIGMVLAALLFMKRMADVTEVSELTRDTAEEDDSFTPKFDRSLLQRLPQHIQVYEINGPLFFGAADKFLEVINEVDGTTQTMILRLRNVPAMDATAVHALKRFIKACHKHKIKILLSGLKPQPYEVLSKAGVIDTIGEEHIFEHFEAALAFAENRHYELASKPFTPV
ncbi:MAG: STAS domain-containing protein [Firmicutes bacterium]|nr:STAS domain-containing protein [Bacillota bacterium]